jgi:hypothetical protein
MCNRVIIYTPCHLLYDHSRRMRWVGHVTIMGKKRNAYEVSIWKLAGPAQKT